MLHHLETLLESAGTKKGVALGNGNSASAGCDGADIRRAVLPRADFPAAPIASGWFKA
jgi:hypothetical protein